MAQHGIACQCHQSHGQLVNHTNTYVLTISCTPHFKDDAQQPWWVTQENVLGFGYWFNPKEGLTLEDMATAVENFADSNLNKMQPQTVNVNVRSSGRIESVTIRGQNYSREALVNYRASDCLYDGEVFNVSLLQNTQITVRPIGTVQPIGCCTIL